MITAITIVTSEPGNLFDTRVYHSGKKRYTTVINSKMGTQNKTAMGNPCINLAPKLCCFSLCFSQYCMNSLSFSESMLQN